MSFFIIIIVIIGIVIILKIRSNTFTKEQPSKLFPSESKTPEVSVVGKSKIYMCIKELKWALEAMPQSDKGYILALATFVRIKLIKSALNELNLPEDMLESPLRKSENQLFILYNFLENIRNTSEVQRKQTEKDMKNVGMDLPEYSKGHSIAYERSLEVWMCTLGAGIALNRNKDVNEIWKLLMDSIQMIEVSIEKIMNFADKTSEDTGFVDTQHNDLFNSVDSEVWKKECYGKGRFRFD